MTKWHDNVILSNPIQWLWASGLAFDVLSDDVAVAERNEE